MTKPDNDFREIEQLPDGSSVYEVGPFMDEKPEEDSKDFHANLAVNFPEDGLKKLSSFLLEAIEEDLKSRKDWMDTVEAAKQYLGFGVQDLKLETFKRGCKTFDTTLATALIRFYSTTRAELLPQTGPAGYRINGQETPEIQGKAERRKDWLNYFLTIVDESYYLDFERFLLYLGLYGSGFKKVYYDPILQRPIVRFIVPQDFIINGDCASILESTRLTHVLRLSKREILLNQQNNIYREVELFTLDNTDSTENEDYVEKRKNDDFDLDQYTKLSLYTIYEVHAYLSLEEFRDNLRDNHQNDIPLPYIITIDVKSKEILSIRRNWEENDTGQKRKNYFVQYNYLPGFGIYGLGLAHLLGSNAITLTTVLRQLVDAGSFKNLPGGIRSKGMKPVETDLVVGPGEFVEVDTGGVPLREAFMPLPYSEPSAALRDLRLEIVGQTKELGSTSELGMLDSKEDIPTGTALAVLENHGRIQSAVLRSIHYSLTRELQLLDQVFKENLDYEVFTINGMQQVISKEDFVDEVTLIPISDPVANSKIERIIKAESVLKIAASAPQAHNMKAVYALMYKAQGLDEQEIQNILTPENAQKQVIPLDPISENMNAMRGMPLKAAIWQDHDAHILSHASFVNELPDIKAHIQEHRAFKYLVEMQMQLGFELPPLEQLQEPEIQNEIAFKVAQVATAENTDLEARPQPIDPNEVMMADIQQKQVEAEGRERMANLKAETDIFKAQLDFEKEKAKIESNEDIAQLKAETDLTKQENKNGY